MVEVHPKATDSSLLAVFHIQHFLLWRREDIPSERLQNSRSKECQLTKKSRSTEWLTNGKRNRKIQFHFTLIMVSSLMASAANLRMPSESFSTAMRSSLCCQRKSFSSRCTFSTSQALAGKSFKKFFELNDYSTVKFRIVIRKSEGACLTMSLIGFEYCNYHITKLH